VWWSVSAGPVGGSAGPVGRRAPRPAPTGPLRPAPVRQRGVRVGREPQQDVFGTDVGRARGAGLRVRVEQRPLGGRSQPERPVPFLVVAGQRLHLRGQRVHVHSRALEQLPGRVQLRGRPQEVLDVQIRAAPRVGLALGTSQQLARLGREQPRDVDPLDGAGASEGVCSQRIAAEEAVDDVVEGPAEAGRERVEGHTISSRRCAAAARHVRAATAGSRRFPFRLCRARLHESGRAQPRQITVLSWTGTVKGRQTRVVVRLRRPSSSRSWSGSVGPSRRLGRAGAVVGAAAKPAILSMLDASTNDGPVSVGLPPPSSLPLVRFSHSVSTAS
jgi:hypothetical protein